MTENEKRGSRRGFELEEVLRAYFLRAGFFVLRGVIFELEGEELTDIDLWLYERPTGTTRRRQVVDIKGKHKPKAKERLLWAKGLSEILGVDGTYVATTDTSVALRKIAAKFGISLLDGTDLKRIADSEKVVFPERLSEEALSNLIKSVDKSRLGKEYWNVLQDLKDSVVAVFGANSAVRALQSVEYFAKKTIEAHPNSDAAKTAGRLTYFSAAIAAISLDYVGTDFSFRNQEERLKLYANAIRYGNPDASEGLHTLNLAQGLVRKYLPNGSAVANTLQQAIEKDYQKIPAEIIAEYIIRLDKGDGLFNAAKDLEAGAYRLICPPFDALNLQCRSFLGVVLDFAGVERKAFASAWTEAKSSQSTEAVVRPTRTEENSGPLFSRARK